MVRLRCLVITWTALILFSRPLTAADPGLESWTDSRMPVKSGVFVWFDASRLSSALQDRGVAGVAMGGHVGLWPDGSGHRRDLRQPIPDRQPTLLDHQGLQALEFSGLNHHLQGLEPGQSLTSTTVFLVTAPYSNPEAFAGWLSLSEPARNDYETGLNIDQGVGAPSALQVINIEGAGNGGLRNLLPQPIPFGTLLRCCIVSSPGKSGTRLLLNGKPQGSRDRTGNTQIHADHLVVGARRYTHGGPPEPRGFYHGAIAELLIFDRELPPTELAAVETYLERKYGSVAPLPVPGLTTAGKPLDRVKSPPPVQVFLPGFTVRELPVHLKNINNLLYRPDGKLLALGYNGQIWLLSDTDGDGLEETATVYWDSQGQMRAPVGMDLLRGGPHPRGIVVASKGKCSVLVESSDGTRAEREIVVASGWKESPHGVDALGVAVDARDGSIVFGLGTQDYTNAYVIGQDGSASYSLASERGTLVRVAPDFQSREILATGIRFPVGLRFNRAGDLFCSDQEGATWLPNGNPFDELLHVQKGRHYGFPPRHPLHLPGVIDEPSTFDYGPQHQSTCGFCFNEPVRENCPTFGPARWKGDVFMTGYSRGKLYRTQLEKTPQGYLARNSLLACLNMLTADCCLTPSGGLLVACHSGGPDWGSGPTGEGRLFLISADASPPAQPVFAWPASDRELRVEFDQPVDPALLRDAVSRIDITAGRFVRAGDRFESLWPGYAVVQSQHRAPRHDVKVYSAQLTPDRRTLVLATGPLRQVVSYAVSFPGLGRPGESQTHPSVLPQQPAIDLDFDLSGVEATWETGAGSGWTGWLPSLDLQAARRWTADSASHDALWQATRESRGTLTLTATLDLTDMLRPEVQPGSRIDYSWPDETVSLHLRSPIAAEVRVMEGSQSVTPLSGTWTLRPRRDRRIAITIRLPNASFDELQQFGLSYSTQEDARQRPLPLHRVRVPWSEPATEAPEATTLPLRRPELEGGRWAAGWRIFHHAQTGCIRCHSVQGQGSKIGPDLTNLIHRDYRSVLRDIQQPSFAINPDYVGSILTLTDGRVITGVVRTEGGRLSVSDKEGKTILLNTADVEESQPASVSIMPEGLLKSLSPQQTQDLLTYLLTPGPSMPREDPGVKRPSPRRIAEVRPYLEGAEAASAAWSKLRVVLVAGPKDHGPGEHDYPAWLKAWQELLSLADEVDVVAAMNWPDADEFDKADVMVFYQRGDWTPERAAAIDRFLERGKGLVYIHWAVDGQKDSPGFARRIALAWGNGSRFRHGPFDLAFGNSDHPITRGFTTLKLVDESYWNLTGLLPVDRILATGNEENRPQPLFWSLEQGRGRVFVSIPGHYSWTFDDPLYRLLLLRAIAWTGQQPVDRLNPLIWPGADVVP